MRPTGVTLIALYHYLAAVILTGFGVSLFVGGKFISMLGGGDSGMLPKAGFLIGVVGGVFCLALALLYAIAGFGVWSMREWGRILSIVMAVISLVFAVPGLLLTVMTMHVFFFGGLRILRIAISVLVIWYLMQPQVKAVFRSS